MADAFPERGRIISAPTGTRLRARPEWAEKAAAEKHRTVARASRAAALSQAARKEDVMDQEKRNAVLEARSVLQERLNTLADNKDVFGDLPGTEAYAAALVLAVEAFDRWLEGGAEA